MRRVATVLFVQAVVCMGLFAQSVSQITGIVQDSSGLAVPGADITVTQTDTGLTRSAQSGRQRELLICRVFPSGLTDWRSRRQASALIFRTASFCKSTPRPQSTLF